MTTKRPNWFSVRQERCLLAAGVAAWRELAWSLPPALTPRIGGCDRGLGGRMLSDLVRRQAANDR